MSSNVKEGSWGNLVERWHLRQDLKEGASWPWSLREEHPKTKGTVSGSVTGELKEHWGVQSSWGRTRQERKKMKSVRHQKIQIWEFPILNTFLLETTGRISPLLNCHGHIPFAQFCPSLYQIALKLCFCACNHSKHSASFFSVLQTTS